MKILATLGVLFLAAPATLLAQKEGERKVRIEITRNENGYTTHLTKEFDLNDEKQLVDALRELGVIDELNILGSDENLVLDMRRMREGGALNDMSIAMCIPNAEAEQEASAYLGVYYGDWDGGCDVDMGEVKDKKGKKDKAPIKEGACITAVESGTPAEAAGLQQGDVITQLGKKKVSGGETLVDAINSHKPGEEVTIVFYRGKDKKEVTVVLGQREEEEAPSWNWNWNDEDGAWGGFGEGNWPMEPQPFLGVDGQDVEGDKGVEVTNVVEGSSAEKMGMKEKDVIKKINDKNVATFELLAEIIGEMQPGEDVEVEVMRDGKSVTLKGELGQKDGPAFRMYAPTPGEAPEMMVIPEMPEMPDMMEFRELMPQMQNNEELREAQREYREAQREYEQAQREYRREYQDVMRQEMDELRLEMDRLRQDLRGEVTREMRVSISAVELTSEESALLKNKGVSNLDKSLDVQDLRCFPNPMQGNFNISFNAPHRGDLNVDVHDATGDRVYHETITGFKGRYERVLDLSDKTDGTYFVVISQAGASVARKLVKQ